MAERHLAERVRHCIRVGGERILVHAGVEHCREARGDFGVSAVAIAR